MSKLAEIEEATERLPPEQKQELMLFLAARLRAEGARAPEPRKYSREQIQSWLAEDEAELNHAIAEKVKTTRILPVRPASR